MIKTKNNQQGNENLNNTQKIYAERKIIIRYHILLKVGTISSKKSWTILDLEPLKMCQNNKRHSV